MQTCRRQLGKINQTRFGAGFHTRIFTSPARDTVAAMRLQITKISQFPKLCSFSSTAVRHALLRRVERRANQSTQALFWGADSSRCCRVATSLFPGGGGASSRWCKTGARSRPQCAHDRGARCEKRLGVCPAGTKAGATSGERSGALQRLGRRCITAKFEACTGRLGWEIAIPGWGSLGEPPGSSGTDAFLDTRDMNFDDHMPMRS